jgi:hypothetical protein
MPDMPVVPPSKPGSVEDVAFEVEQSSLERSVTPIKAKVVRLPDGSTLLVGIKADGPNALFDEAVGDVLVDGVSLAQMGAHKGYFKAWDSDLQEKPNWCDD